MISHNSGLTKPHPYSSSASSWPFVLRGLSFWEAKEGLRQIYLLGNPIVWWLSIFGTLLYAVLWLIDRILLRRGIDDFGFHARRWWDRSLGFLWILWAIHWFPFFLMGRMLFLHHYLPSFIFSTMITAGLADFLFRILLIKIPARDVADLKLPVSKWINTPSSKTFIVFVSIVCLAAFCVFIYFSPLTYGTGFSTIERLRARKWISSWDLQYY